MTSTTPPDDPSDKPEVAGPPTPAPVRAAGGALPLSYAGIIAVLLVIAAVGGGLAVGTIARPSPSPRPTPKPTATGAPTPLPTTDPAVFRQTLSSGCATEQGLWVVANGGGLVRYDGKDWTQVDGTLRTLTNTSCDAGTLYAVGPVGAVLILDDRARQIQSFDVTLEDLRGVAAMPQGAMVVGTQGTVMLLLGGTWQPYANGLAEDLNAIVVFELQSAWVVGEQGISYRLESAGWRPVPTGVTVDLRAVGGTGPQQAWAVGDGGTFLIFDGTWKPVQTGVTANLRAIARLGGALWIVGDAGTVLILDAAGGDHTQPRTVPPTQFDLRTTCDLGSVFVVGPDVWIIGGRGGVSGVWRIRDGKVAERWGEC
ncbi:MAG: hypothetical protein M3O80_00530 [Chloroflexota bacterium]|nr:hypothetical protein [Chloroflexota bacterium]